MAWVWFLVLATASRIRADARGQGTGEQATGCHARHDIPTLDILSIQEIELSGSVRSVNSGPSWDVIGPEPGPVVDDER
jgi:hypothetical protein